MLIHYYQCDYCKEKIEDGKRKKYKTKEMGYPFIPKDGGGKHFHYDCLEKYYKKQKLSKQLIEELMDDADRRHSKHLTKDLKKGSLTKEKLEQRRATKKDRDSLINYFYNYYGAISIARGIQTTIDRLNRGEDVGGSKGTVIPYYQLEDMLVYYKNTLNSYYRSKKEKGKLVDVTDRIFFDIIFCINNIDDYAKHHKATYNQAHNVVKVDGGEEIFDNSKVLVANRAIKLRESEKLAQEVEQVKRLLEMTDDDDWGE